MPLIISEIILTEAVYIQHELQSKDKHEYINGKLITKHGESDLNNEIAMNVAFIPRQLLKQKGYSIYIEGVKVKIPDEPKYYYPDVFATREVRGNEKQYIKYEPEIIVEVLSETTRKYDMVDKFINYQKIPSLLYYLLTEPEQTLVQLFYKTNNDWEVLSFTNLNDIIDMPLLNIKVLVKDIYQLA